jgi:ABC-type multidrug transport system ATPase subunit
MSRASPFTPVLQLHGVTAFHDNAKVLRHIDLAIPCGLTAIAGDEGTGKTTLLRLLSGDLQPASGSRSPVDALWLDLRLPDHDEHTPREVWTQLQGQCPRWNHELLTELTHALGLTEHLDKHLFMLSAGSRRKVALAALLASGATVTCIDQPWAALDLASIRIIREFLHDMADHPSRAWVVADYEPDPELPWNCKIHTPASFTHRPDKFR